VKTTTHNATPSTLWLWPLLAMTAGLPAAAQQATLEEVIVTSQRRVENLQQVPVAVSAFSAEAIQDADIHDLTDIATHTPGFTFSPFSPGQNILSLRGVSSNDDGAGTDNSVAVFLDEVYIGRVSNVNFEMFDLERIEVLRGPQGTLFGKNTIGGAINVVSAKPTDELVVKMAATPGRFEQLNFQGLVSGPLTDSLKGKIAFSSRKREGWVHNVVLNKDQKDVDNAAVRGQLLWEGDGQEVLLSVDLNRDDVEDMARTPTRSGSFPGVFDPDNRPVVVDPETGEVVLDPETGEPRRRVIGGVVDVYNSYCVGADRSCSANPTDGHAIRESKGASLKWTGEVMGGELVSISAYRESLADWEMDSIGVPGSARLLATSFYRNEFRQRGLSRDDETEFPEESERRHAESLNETPVEKLKYPLLSLPENPTQAQREQAQAQENKVQPMPTEMVPNPIDAEADSLPGGTPLSPGSGGPSLVCRETVIQQSIEDGNLRARVSTRDMRRGRPGPAPTIATLQQAQMDAQTALDADPTNTLLRRERDVAQFNLDSLRRCAEDRLRASAVATERFPDITTTAGLVDDIVDETTQFSQELRYSDELEAYNLNYVAGLYYLREETERTETFRWTTEAAGGSGNNFEEDTYTQENETNSYAVFGHAQWAATERLTFGLGGRFTYETKDFLNVSKTGDGSFNIIARDFTGSISEEWSNFSPKFTADYQWNDEVLLYGSVSRGFKSGGFPAAVSFEEDLVALDPETATSFEIGMKSDLFDNTLRFNPTFFYVDYSDLQFQRFGPPEDDPDAFGRFTTTNAGGASVLGFELEATWVPVENLRIDGAYSYMDSEYDDFVFGGRSRGGQELTRTPKNKYGIVAAYIQDLFNGGSIKYRLDYRHTGDQRGDIASDPTLQPAFDLLDLSLVWTSPKEAWEVSLWSKNVLDEEYISHIYVVGSGDIAVFGDPRTYGLTFRYNM